MNIVVIEGAKASEVGMGRVGTGMGRGPVPVRNLVWDGTPSHPGRTSTAPSVPGMVEPHMGLHPGLEWDGHMPAEVYCPEWDGYSPGQIRSGPMRVEV